MSSLSWTLEMELCREPIRVVELRPGDIRTDFHKTMECHESLGEADSTDNIARAYRAYTANMERAPPPERVARLVLNLLDDDGKVPSQLNVGSAFQARIADRLVFSKLRARTGGNVRFFVSGGAPLPSSVARFLLAAGLPVLEGYGLTETSPALTFNRLDALRIGTVGVPISGTEIRIAADGEILARGPQIMQGYHNRPEATAEAIDGEGWFHTGDVGEIDGDGYLRITDRKKDLIITAYGKNIAPQPIEGEIKRHPLVAEAVMLGDQQKFPIVVLVPDFDAARSVIPELADESDEDLVQSGVLRDAIESAVADRCSDLAHHERPREILILQGPFTVESGELTPKLSVKRRVISERYGEQIQALYERAERERGA